MSIPLAEFIPDLDADNLPGPRAHYALGWLPRWSRIASLMPRAANLAMRLPLVGRVALFAAGVDQRRSIPSFAPKTFRQWFASTAHTRSSAGKPVLLFIDSFNNHFTPSVAEAMVDVLESAGYSPRLIEPSCTGVLRSEALELLNNEASRDVAAATHTLAELLLNDAEWQAPDLTEISVAVAEQQLLPAVRASDASAVILADGFSCRTQLDDLSDRKGQHLAEILGGTTKPRS